MLSICEGWAWLPVLLLGLTGGLLDQGVPQARTWSFSSRHHQVKNTSNHKPHRWTTGDAFPSWTTLPPPWYCNH